MVAKSSLAKGEVGSELIKHLKSTFLIPNGTAPEIGAYKGMKTFNISSTQSRINGCVVRICRFPQRVDQIAVGFMPGARYFALYSNFIRRLGLD